MNINIYALRTALLLLLILLSVGLPKASSAQSIKTDPGHRENVSVAGLQFSCPNSFELQPEHTNDQLAFMRHEKYELGLFVAVLEKNINSRYVKQLAIQTTSYLYPKGKSNYAWKRLKGYEKVSKFEIDGGMVQGFNGQQRVCVQYRRIKVQQKEVVVGYVFELGSGELAKQLFERNLGGDSMEGGYAQAHVIASMTREKYDDLAPATGFVAAPPPPKP